MKNFVVKVNADFVVNVYAEDMSEALKKATKNVDEVISNADWDIDNTVCMESHRCEAVSAIS